MNYQKIYDAICKRGQERILPKEVYSEKHHIVPKCLGGGNEKSNITTLTAREHFLVHYILTRIYPNDKRMWFTLNIMLRMKKFPEINCGKGSRLYEFIRTEVGKQRSGKNHHLFGIGHSPEACKRISDGRKGKFLGENNHMFGKKRSEETKQRISEGRKGIPVSDETKRKQSESKKGKPLSKEHCQKIKDSKQNISEITREKLSIASKGKKRSEKTKELMSIAKIGINNSFFGKSHSDETKEVMRQNSGTAVKIIIEGVTYRSISFAAKCFDLTTAIVLWRLKSEKLEWKDWFRLT